MSDESRQWPDDTMAELDDFSRRVAAPLRAPEPAEPTLATRVMNAVRRDVRGDPTPWWRRSVEMRVTPLGGLAIAAGLAAIVFAAASTLPRREQAAAPTAAAASADTIHVVRFVFVAPGVSSVAIVGDFNGWDVSANRLVRVGTSGLWSASVPLEAGRHEYAFVIDGTRWVADPTATRAISDEFGGESSVIRVGAEGHARSG